MDKVLDNEFAFINLFTGVLMLITGILFIAFPPKKLRWYNTLPLPSNWQYNEEIQLEAMRWTIKPIFFMGILFTGLGVLALAFPSIPFFSLQTATLFMIVCCFITNYLRKRHLKRLFDDHGNSRANA